jgi:iron complex outermembrane receptor protein
VAEFGVQHDAYRLRTRVDDLADWIAGAPGVQASRFEGRTALTSLWAQDTWRFAPDWRAVLGLRAERWRAERGVTANASTAFAHPERSETHRSPKAAIGWAVSDDWTLKLSTGRALRMPTVSELYQGGLNALGQLANGDPALRPERSQTTEASAEWLAERHSLRVTLFHEATKDALYAQLNAANVNTVQNVDRIRTSGLELAGQRRRLGWSWLDLSGSVTFADSVITANRGFPASVGKQQPRVPRWRATLLATVTPADAWSGTLGLRYGGTQFNTLDNSDAVGARYQGTSRFLVADARLRWQVDKQWSAAVGEDNLGDRTYWNFHPYPQRTWVAELKFDL